VRRPRAPRRGLSAIGTRGRLVLALAAIGAFCGLVWGLGGEARYESTASVVLADREDADELAEAGGEAIDPTADDAVGRLVEIAASREVARTAAANLGGDVGGADLLARVEARPGEERTVEIVAGAESADYAAAAADAYAEALVEIVGRNERQRLRATEEELTERLAEIAAVIGAPPAQPVDPATGEPLDPEAIGEPTVEEAAELAGRIRALERLRRGAGPLIVGRAAELPVEPAERRHALAWMGGGLLTGALLGLLLAGLLGLAHRPVRDLRGLRRASGVDPVFPIAAADPIEHLGRGRLAIGAEAGDDPFVILDELGLLDGEPGPTVALAATEGSAVGGEVALALAVSAAEEGAKVICLDTDMANPWLGPELGLETAPGLAEYLEGEATPREVMRSLAAGVGGGAGALVVVPSGSPTVPPLDLLGGARFRALIDRVGRIYDLALFITAPLADGGEAGAVIRGTDDLVLCARRHMTPARELARARANLHPLEPLAGVLAGPERRG
jgi:hypothetical protein